ncbi:MAG: FG-GAP repeat protein [Verrucomicrobiota bacterium]|nr:FG-GAP repeat protein [Verrucomicrobiota bacterium]
MYFTFFLRTSSVFQKVLCLLLVGVGVSLLEAAPPKPQSVGPDQIPKGLAKSDWQSIRAAYEAGRHEFKPIEGGWQARNPGQQWTTKFDGRGFTATPREGNWTWGLELESYGRGTQQRKVNGQPAVKAEGQKLSYQWDKTLLEWWVNDQRGLEHGYTLTQRPETQDPSDPAVLTLLIGTRGTLMPKVTPDALGVSFCDGSGAAVLNYAGLKVWDADHKELGSRFESAGNGRVRLVVEEGTARYPITIDPIAQQAYVKLGNGGNSDANDQLGPVAVDGDTVVVGAANEDSSTTGVNSTPNDFSADAGAAYVFVRNGATWSQQAYLKASQVNASDSFGWSVAVSGDTVVVGAIREDSSTTGINSTPNEGLSDAGAAYVFVRSGVTWSQQAYLKASQVTAGDGFGSAVAVSGDMVVIGALGEDSSTTGINSTPNEGLTDAGAAYVFVRSGVTWSQQAYLKASQVTAGDSFGSAVGLSGDTVVVGAMYEDSSTTGTGSTPNEGASNAGAAYVFVRSGVTWSQHAYLKASQVTAGDGFGSAVAVSGDTVVIGAQGEDSSTTGINSTPNEALGAFGDAGAAYVFVRSGTTWSQQAYLKASNTGASDSFGISVAVSGDTVVVGACREDSGTTGINSAPDESATDAGAAYVFVRSGTTWSQQAYLKASNTGAADQFGLFAAVSGDTVVIGAPREDSGTVGINSTPDELATDAGVAYVLVRSGTTWSQEAYVKPSDTGPANVGDNFGSAVAVDGDTVVIGAPREDSSTTGINSTPNEALGAFGDAGAAYVFVRSGTTWSQQAYLKASQVTAGDSFGWSVAVSGDTVLVGAMNEDSSTTGVNSAPNESAANAGAAYVFVRSGTTWSQQAYLKASQVTAGDSFGVSVAASGDTVTVGAYFEDSGTTGINSTADEGTFNAGAAYVFVRSGTTWSQQAYLKASQVNYDDRFGISVALSGDTVVIGAQGEDSSTTGINSIPNEYAAGAGAAYVFVRSGTTWSQQAYLKASQVTAGDYFGYSVAVSGDTLVVGASGEDSSTVGVNSTSDELATDAGAAYVFVRGGTTWSQQAYLKAGDAGSSGAFDEFGRSVAVSGDTVVVGADGEDSSTAGVNSLPDELAADAGAAYVFVRSGTIWSQQAYLKTSNTGAGDHFGEVAVSGDTVVVGALYEDSRTTGINSTPNESATNAGAAYIFIGLGPTFTVPTVTSPTAATSIAAPNVMLGGNVIADGGSIITERGVVYSATVTNADPLIGGTGVIKVSGIGTIGVFTVAVTGLTQGTNYSYKAYAINSIGTSYTSVRTFTALTLIQSWRQMHFGILASSGSAADDADPDHDGLPNLLEYALNLPPNAASRVPAAVQAAGGNLEYTYTRGAAAYNGGTTFQVEWSDDLTTWFTSGVVEGLLSDDGTLQQVKATLPAGSAGRRFVRLRVQ